MTFPRCWSTTTLGQAGHWSSGGTPSTTEPAYWGGDIPWIGSGSLTQFCITDSKRRITELGAASGTRLVGPGTLLMVVRGMSLLSEFRMGLTARTVAFGQDCKALVPRAGLDPLYLAYALKAKTTEILELVDRAGHGTGRLNMDQLSAVTIGVPGDREQRGIALTLAVLDDKIESDRRTDELCLALAVETYRAACLKASQRLALGDAGKWLSGGTPSTEEPAFWSGDFPWISAANLKSFHVAVSDRRLTTAGLQRATNVVPAGTVLLVVRGMSLKSELRMGVAQRPVAFGQDVKAIIPMLVPSALLATALYSARSDILELVDEAGHGTGRLQWDLLSAFPIAIPDDERLVPVLDALLARAAAASAQNRKLAELRDALLPELLSGRLRVPEAATT